MELTVTRAETEAELAEVFGLRYEVYVEEMGRYRDTADHERRQLSDPEDAHSWVFAGHRDGRLVATGRLTWGGDAGFSERQRLQYRLDPFLAELPEAVMGIGERLMVRPELRGTPTLDQLLDGAKALTEHLGIRVMFGACEPHLLSLYLRMGQRTYADRNINSAEAGYLIPLINFVPPDSPLEGLGGATDPDTGAPALPRCIAQVLANEGAVTSGILADPNEYGSEIARALHEISADIHAFAGFTDDETRRCVERSNIIH
ncbi:MAG TPA: GNAT family N-acyltransferase, partial [Acidimicrobiia bacterium]|nr:GNAT family N-acyltransferase [Acidimicrobiia bacterium]